MPLIQVTAPKGALSTHAKTTLISRLSDAVLKAEGAAVDDDAAQSLVWAHYIEMPEGNIYVGGQNPASPPFRIAVTTPEGALTPQSRKCMVKEIGTIIDGITGSGEAGLNHWVMLNEVRDGSWGGGGQILHLGDIQAAMNITPVPA